MGTLNTVPGWESILAKHVALAKNAPPVEYGKHDCILQTRDIIEACCNVDILLGRRYHDARDLVHITGGDFAGFLDDFWQVFVSVEPRLMQRLDFGYYETEGRLSVGVCTGTKILVALNTGGRLLVPKSKVQKAWRPIYGQ